MLAATATKESLPSESGLRGLCHRISSSRFPLKPETLDEFCKLVQRRLEEGKSLRVEITPGLERVTRGSQGSEARAAALIAGRQYVVVCNAIDNGKSPIQYVRPLFHANTNFDGMGHVGDNPELGKVIAILAARELMLRLTARLPNAPIRLGAAVGSLSGAQWWDQEQLARSLKVPDGFVGMLIDSLEPTK